MSSIPSSPSKIYGIVDCDSFYNSVEVNFQPQFRGLPCLSLSNNDGCVVSRNKAAKELGIQMGVPIFKIRDKIAKYGIVTFSANYVLYGDMSSRVMDSLAMFAPDIEVYSIDEAWLDLTPFSHQNVTEYAHHIKDTVSQWTGIPVSLGVATTKTLAKVSLQVAKETSRYNSVFNLDDSPEAESILATFPVADIWGIGRQYNKWLNAQGIETAKELRDANEGLIRKKMGVVGVRMIHELRGISCLPLKLVAKPKKETCVSRSFGQPVTKLADLQEAIAAYASRAAEKLREQGQVAEAMVVFARTSPFKPGYFRQSVTVTFSIATNYTPAIVEAARKAMERIYEPGREFQKAGVLMVGLASETTIQGHLWEKDEDWEKRKRLMSIMDKVNERFGRGTLEIAASGVRQIWRMQSKWQSPRYTTCWAELPVASC